MADEIRVGDVGTIFQIEVTESGVALDISGATTKEIKFKAPGSATVTQTASFVTDGTEGLIDYTTVSGDLNKQGVWRIQAFLILPGGEWHTEHGEFRVHPNL